MYPDEFTPASKPRAIKPGRKLSAKGVPKKRPLPDLSSEHKLFTGSEVAVVLDVPETWVAAVRKAGAPFPGGRTRPEWVHAWLCEHVKFALKEYRE